MVHFPSASDFILSFSLPPPSTSLPSAIAPIATYLPTMSLSSASSTLLRTCARQQLPSASRAVAAFYNQRRGVSADVKSSFDSPFGSSKEHSSTVKIPNFTKYSSSKSPRSNQVFSYFMAGTMGLATAVGAKATVQGM